jgi:hypothetical protein
MTTLLTPFLCCLALSAACNTTADGDRAFLATITELAWAGLLPFRGGLPSRGSLTLSLQQLEQFEITHLLQDPEALASVINRKLLSAKEQLELRSTCRVGGLLLNTGLMCALHQAGAGPFRASWSSRGRTDLVLWAQVRLLAVVGLHQPGGCFAQNHRSCQAAWLCYLKLPWPVPHACRTDSSGKNLRTHPCVGLQARSLRLHMY